MRLLFSGQAFAQFHWLYLGERLADPPDHTDCYEHQNNGLCGTRCPNYAHLYVGSHTGPVDISVRWCDERPSLDSAWDEVVEATLLITRHCELHLAGFDGSWGEPLSLEPGTYRVRMSVSNFGLLERSGSGASPTLAESERYEVSLWSAEFEDDQVVRCKSDEAKRRHESRQAGRADYLRARWPHGPSWVECLAPTLGPDVGQLAPDLAERLTATATTGEEFMNRSAFALAADQYVQALQLVADAQGDWGMTTWLWASLGEARFMARAFDTSAEAFGEALECTGALGTPFLHLRLGQCALEVGDEPAAMAHFSRVHALHGSEAFACEEAKYLEFFQSHGAPLVFGRW